MYERMAEVPPKDQVGLLLVLLKQLQPFLNQPQAPQEDSQVV